MNVLAQDLRIQEFSARFDLFASRDVVTLGDLADRGFVPRGLLEGGAPTEVTELLTTAFIRAVPGYEWREATTSADWINLRERPAEEPFTRAVEAGDRVLLIPDDRTPAQSYMLSVDVAPEEWGVLRIEADEEERVFALRLFLGRGCRHAGTKCWGREDDCCRWLRGDDGREGVGWVCECP